MCTVTQMTLLYFLCFMFCFYFINSSLMLFVFQDSLTALSTCTPTSYKRKVFDLLSWDKLLCNFPDRIRYNTFRNNLRYGWRIGLTRPFPNRYSSRNKFKKEELNLIAQQVHEWYKENYIFGPIDLYKIKQAPAVLNHFFAVPKDQFIRYTRYGFLYQ